MGNTSARTRVDQTIDQLFKVINDTSQDCRTDITAEQRDRFRNIGGDILIEDIDYSQLIGVSSECLLSSKVQNELQNNVEAAVKQQAEAIGQQFSLTSVESETVTNLLTKLAVEMQNNVSVKCPLTIAAYQGYDVSDVAGNVTIRAIKRNQVVNAMRKCVVDVENVTAIRAQLVTAIEQTSKAKTESLLAGLLQALVFIVIILGAVALVAFKGTALLAEPLFWMGLILLLGAVLIVNYFLGWIPYRDVSPNDTSDSAAADRSFNRTVLLIVVIVTLIDAGLIAAFMFLRARSKTPKPSVIVKSPTPAAAAPKP